MPARRSQAPSKRSKSKPRLGLSVKEAMRVRAAVSVCVLLGCRGGSAALPFEAGPAASVAPKPVLQPIVFADAGALELEPDLHLHDPDGVVAFELRENMYTIILRGLPVDSSLNDVTTLVTSIDVTKDYAELSPGDAFRCKAIRPAVKYTLQVPGYEPLTRSVPPRQACRAIAQWFAGVPSHPLLFPGESQEDAPVSVHSAYDAPRMQVWGDAKTLREVDWIATSADLPARKKTCAINRSPYTHKTTLTLAMVDDEITVRERKTSRVVASRRVAASSQCPSEDPGPGWAPDGELVTIPEPDDASAWLRSLMK
jgi:hypothetical protein